MNRIIYHTVRFVGFGLIAALICIATLLLAAVNFASDIYDNLLDRLDRRFEKIVPGN